jgi:hypothetical protein
MVSSPSFFNKKGKRMKLRKIKDCEGLEWTLNVTAGSLLKACRNSGMTLNDLMSMEIKIESILEAVPFFCEKQIKERGMSHDDFLERFGIKEIQEVAKELFPAVAESFPEQEEGQEVEAGGEEGAPLGHGNAPTS